MSKLKTCLLLGALALGVSPFVTAAEVSVEERLQRIETALARLEARLNDTVSADELAPTLKEYGDLTRQLGWDGKTPITVTKAAGKEKSLSVGGYVQLQGEAGDAPDSRFVGINDRIFVRRARLNIRGSFAEHFDFALQSEFGNSSISGVSGYRLQATDVFAVWNKYDYANIQLGQFKTPFGFEQLLSDTKTLTIERSLPNDQLTFGRQAGATVNGTVAGKRISYTFGLFNGNGTNNGNNDNDQFMYMARTGVVAWTGKPGKLVFGVDAAQSRDTGTFTGERTAWSADSQLTYGPLDFAAEYFHQHLDRNTGADTTADGWYVQAGWYLPGKKWQLLTRYETYDPNTSIAKDDSHDWTFGASYYLKGDDLKFSLNYILGDPAGSLDSQGRVLGRFQLIY